MKNIYKILFIVILTCFNNYSQELDPYQYFPCNVGDHWVYSWYSKIIKYTIVRDSINMIDGKHFLFYDPFSPYGALYSLDKKYQVYMDPQFSGRLLYKLDAKVGDSWTSVPKLWAEKVLSISQGYVFGKYTNIMKIGFYRLSDRDSILTEKTQFSYWQKLAYGFGLISEEDGATQPTLLLGCIIKGVKYGTVDAKEKLEIIPSEFVLYQNYPNPFNPTTQIDYQIKEKGIVTLKVYDILGGEVITLVDEEKDSGYYSVKFDAGKLSSGMYFYRLSTSTYSQTKKMFLAK